MKCLKRSFGYWLYMKVIHRLDYKRNLFDEVFLWYFRTCDERKLTNLAHLVHVDAKIRTSAYQAISIGRREAIFGDQPVHQVKCRRLDRDFQWLVGVDGDQGVRFFDSHPRNFLGLDDVELDLDRRLGLGGGSREFGVALRCMDVA